MEEVKIKDLKPGEDEEKQIQKDEEKKRTLNIQRYKLFVFNIS